MSDTPNQAAVAAFYDTQAERKLRDFVFGNGRIERAWETIIEHSGQPARILEVGCGVGSICWRLSREFPLAAIVGIDVSSGNLEIARRVFAAPNVTFVLMDVADQFSFGEFDVIVLMDVYEHVSVEQRSALHENVRRSLSTNGRVILTVPTPRNLAWIRAHQPEGLQPVDEDVTVTELARFASEIDRDVLMYRDVNVWRQGDYAHAVLGRSAFPDPVPAPPSSWHDRFRERRAMRDRKAVVINAGVTLSD